MLVADAHSRFLPWDKSWAIRMGVLDILDGRGQNTVTLLSKESHLGEDLLALQRAALMWDAGVPVDVGESGTLYRFLQFASWKRGAQKEFVLQGTLKKRPITVDSRIARLSQSELLKLDHGTSQWASAAVLCGDDERLPDAPHKLALTYLARDYWRRARRNGVAWEPRLDHTIACQAKAFEQIMRYGGSSFFPQHSEDFCFAFMFCGMSSDDGVRRWPSLSGHESDRIAEIGMARRQAMSGKVVQSRDHRVVQAVAMWGAVSRKTVAFSHPGAVNKSWPRFWDYLKAVTASA